MVQCRVPLLDHIDLPFGKPKENLVQSISCVQVVLTLVLEVDVLVGTLLQCNTQLCLVIREIVFVFHLNNSSFLLPVFSKAFTHCSK